MRRAAKNPGSVDRTLMASKNHRPSFHASDLRAILLAEVPSLTGALIDCDPAEPHRDMSVLFKHVAQAIKDRDVREVIKCFRLTRKLLELDDKYDVFVRSAIWTSYIRRFNPNDPLALDIFRAIDPQVRDSLYSPFIFPHTWIRETEICLPNSEDWPVRLTVGRPTQAGARLVRQQCCPGHFAVVVLQLEPYLDRQVVLFRNRLPDSHDAPLAYIKAVVDGIARAAREQSSPKKGLSYLRIDLLDLRHHPVDSRVEDFNKAAVEAMDRCINQAGLVEI